MDQSIFTVKDTLTNKNGSVTVVMIPQNRADFKDTKKAKSSIRLVLPRDEGIKFVRGSNFKVSFLAIP